MGALVSKSTSLLSRCSTTLSRWSHRFRRQGRNSDPIGHEPLPDDIEQGRCESKANGAIPTPKRRALLVGISYKRRPSEVWAPLEGPFEDVTHFRELLIDTHGYAPENITVLKDDPELPEHSQPTRDNMLRELGRLVADAVPGDKFTFLYSGHSDQQPTLDGPEREEDGKDEVIITCDLKRIIDNELRDILVEDLPVGCSLLAILDTCHSGTMLDLPHYRCNNVYVPWLSKGERRTKTFHNKIVRSNAFGIVPESPSRRPPSFISAISSHLLTDSPSSDSPLRVITEIGGTFPTNRRETSVEADQHGAPSRQDSSCSTVLSPTRYDSPVPVGICDGWCGYDIIPCATVVSLSACEDLQRAWEGPRGSLTAVLCRYLKTNPYPSYCALMSHVNIQLHTNCRELHTYTLAEKKKAAQGKGLGFDGEMNNFQAPQLSSLSKLNMDGILCL